MLVVGLFFGMTPHSQAAGNNGKPLGVQRTFEFNDSIYLLASHVFSTKSSADMFFETILESYDGILEDTFEVVIPASGYEAIDTLDQLGNEDKFEKTTYTALDYIAYDSGYEIYASVIIVQKGKNVHVWTGIGMTHSLLPELTKLAIEKMNFTQKLNVNSIKRTLPKKIIGAIMEEEIIGGDEL